MNRAHRRAPRRSARRGLCIKWAVQRGQTPIPFSIHHYRENLDGVAADPLTAGEMREIAAIDRNCRLIKGQVFLWKETRPGKISGT